MIALVGFQIRRPNGTDTARLFSAVVHCDDTHRGGNMWRLGRMEWLAYELVMQARSRLLLRQRHPDDALWTALEKKLGVSRADISLVVAIAPHKMRLTGDELESSAAGSHERSDFWLLARKLKTSEPFTALNMAYHATHMFPGTASLDEAQRYPERRILWRAYVPLPGLM